MLSLSSLQNGLAVVLASTLVACAAPVEADSSPRVGSTSQAIVGGSTSTAQHDAVVQLTIAGDEGKTHNCTGTLVAKNLVLTARHCVGAVDRSSTGARVRDYPASAISIHVGVDAPAKIASGEAPAAIGRQLLTADTDDVLPDVAFVVLDGNVDAPVASIRLGGGAKKGESLVVVGYGLDESNTAPSARKQRDGVSVTAIGPAATDRNDLIAGEFAFGEAACFGDSGGPALSAKTHAVVGVASRVSNGSAAGAPSDVARCIGAEDVYTSLEPVKELVAKAFAAANATPVVESSEAPQAAAPPEATASAEEPDPAADEAAPPTAPKTTTTTTTMSCAASSSTPRGSELGLLVILGAICAMAMRRRA